jgi:hypothetical protein
MATSSLRAQENVFAINSNHRVDLRSCLCQRNLPPKVLGMPIEAICPSCGQKLKVPDALVGKKVRCQKCNSVFMAEEEVEMELVEEPPEDHVEVVEGPPPRKRDEQPVRVIDEEAEEVEDEPRERRRPRRRKRRRATMVDQLRLPALLLQICGYAGAGLNLLGIIFEVVTILASGNRDAHAMAQVTGRICGGLLATVVWSYLVILGARSMSSLHGYSTAIAGCIVSMMPCSCGCFMGLPIGIWCLVVLSQSDVKRAFT